MTHDRRRRRRFLLVGALIALLALWAAVPPPASWVEALYSRGLSRPIAAGLIAVADSVELSIGAAVVLLLGIALPALLVPSLARRRRRGTGWLRWGTGILRKTVVVTALGWAGFLLVWGANYRREPVETLLELPEGGVDEREVRVLAEELLERVRRDLPSPEERDEERALASIRESMGRLLEERCGYRPAIPRRVKRVPPGFFLAFGRSGSIVPVVLEPHVDAALNDSWFLRTAAHELAHSAGLAGEADADLVGILAGLRAEDPFARYAMALHVFRSVTRWLPDGLRDALRSGLPEEARAELARRDEIFARYERPLLASVQSRIYDAYLQSQGVEEGERDYSRAVGLLVRAKRKGLLVAPPAEEAPADGGGRGSRRAGVTLPPARDGDPEQP